MEYKRNGEYGWLAVISVDGREVTRKEIDGYYADYIDIGRDYQPEKYLAEGADEVTVDFYHGDTDLDDGTWNDPEDCFVWPYPGVWLKDEKMKGNYIEFLKKAHTGDYESYDSVPFE